MMEKQIQLPQAVWPKVLVSWAAFFAVLGVLNLWVAYHYSTETWVDFKLFGTMGLMFAFIVAQAIALAKYADSAQAK
jgi:intracellular septation protein